MLEVIVKPWAKFEVGDIVEFDQTAFGVRTTAIGIVVPGRFQIEGTVTVDWEVRLPPKERIAQIHHRAYPPRGILKGQVQLPLDQVRPATVQWADDVPVREEVTERAAALIETLDEKGQRLLRTWLDEQIPDLEDLLVDEDVDLLPPGKKGEKEKSRSGSVACGWLVSFEKEKITTRTNKKTGQVKTKTQIYTEFWYSYELPNRKHFSRYLAQAVDGKEVKSARNRQRIQTVEAQIAEKALYPDTLKLLEGLGVHMGSSKPHY